MTQALVRSTFMVKLAAYAAAHVPPLPISRENQSFTKPTDGATFLEVSVVPANTISANLAADRRRFLGDFQINIWVKQGAGSQAAETIAEELSQIFKVYPKDMLPLSIEAPMKVKMAQEDVSQWWVTVCTVPYRLESDN